MERDVGRHIVGGCPLLGIRPVPGDHCRSPGEEVLDVPRLSVISIGATPRRAGVREGRVFRMSGASYLIR